MRLGAADHLTIHLYELWKMQRSVKQNTASQESNKSLHLSKYIIGK